MEAGVMPWILIGAAAVIIIVWAVKSPRGFRCLFITALEGAAAFFAVNLIGIITGITIAVNTCTLTAAMLCGLPGVISLLMLNYILR